jgi:hypothetical protein
MLYTSQRHCPETLFMQYSATVPRLPTQYEHWFNPRLQENVRISMDAVRALGALTATGAEVGGILLGTSSDESISVEQVLPFACEYSIGPLSRLTVPDRRRLLATVESHGDAFLGFWRSTTHPLPSLDEDDEQLLKAYGAKPRLMLLFQPLAEEANLHLFVQSRTGSWSSAGESRWTLVAPGTTGEPVKALAFTSPGAIEGVGPPGSRVRRSLPLVLAAALVLAIVCAGFWWGRRANRNPAPAAAPLEFRAERHGSDLRLTWNRQGLPPANTVRGRLRIRDGDVNRVVELDDQQVRSGSVLYSPVSGDVHFRLEISDHAKLSLGEDVRVLLPGSEVPAGVPSVPEAVEAVISPGPAVVRQSSPRAADRAVTPTPQPAVTDQAEKPAAGQAAVAVLQAAPAVAQPSPTESQASTVPSAPAYQPPPLSVQVPEQTTPAPKAAAQAVQPSPPAIPPKPAVESRLVPPKVVAQVRPILPAALKMWLRGTVSIVVTVSVDEHGRVAGTSTPAAPDRFRKALQARAEAAARQWTFAPATLNGKAVPSTTTIEFQFAN